MDARTIAALSGNRVKENNPLIDEAVEAAKNYVKFYTGWHIAPVIEETLTLDGTGSRVLQLPSMRVENVTEVTLDGVAIPETAYSWSEDGLLMKKRGVWTHDYRNVTVTLRHGYEHLEALDSVIAGMAIRALTVPTGVTSITVGDRSESYRGTGGAAIAPVMADFAILDKFKLGYEP